MKKLTKHLVVRYVISGGTAAVFNLAVLSLLYYIFHVYYILASVVSFTLAFMVSLILQKFWTFQDRSMHKVHRQAGKYLANSVFGLVVNTAVLYICVSRFHFYVFIGQIIAGIVTAFCTFFISRDYIFNQNRSDIPLP
jgi:putative flippase GtrA